jgi:phosphoglycolate phosphatase-like HAD superfamily hydrolase
MKPEQKFKVGDRVADIHTGKVGNITAIHWSEGDKHNPAEWAYSMDKMGCGKVTELS